MYFISINIEKIHLDPLIIEKKTKSEARESLCSHGWVFRMKFGGVHTNVHGKSVWLYWY